jgi:hypothetical protein
VTPWPPPGVPHASCATHGAEALAAFEATHATEPNRFGGLYGAVRAAEAAGDVAKARAHYTAPLCVNLR